MEDFLKIDILEKWSLWTVLIPYYGQWHEGYILLSTFNKNSRRNLIKNYKAYLYSMKFNKKSVIFNEEGKPLGVRIELMKILKQYPFDFFHPKIIIWTQKWFDIFMNYLISKQKFKNYVEKLNPNKDFSKIDCSKLCSKTEWDKIIITSFLLQQNIDKYLETLHKIIKTDLLATESFFIQGKSWIKYKDSSYSLHLPDTSQFRHKKYSRLLSSPFKIDSLSFSIFRKSSFSSWISSLVSLQIPVESISIPSDLDPSFTFLSTLVQMKPFLKHLSLDLSSQIPLNNLQNSFDKYKFSFRACQALADIQAESVVFK